MNSSHKSRPCCKKKTVRKKTGQKKAYRLRMTEMNDNEMKNEMKMKNEK